MATKGKRIVLILAAAGAAAAMAVAAPAGNAGLVSCPASGQPFSQFGDRNAYFGFANNGFESGATGWSLRGASVGAGNEPWYVNGPGASSLSIAPGGVVSSPLVCAALLAPHWRMFAHAEGADGALRAQIVFYGLLGNVTGVLNLTSLDPSGYAGWAPTSDIPSALALPIATRYAQLRLTSTATTGTWQVDDVFVDPCGLRG